MANLTDQQRAVVIRYATASNTLAHILERTKRHIENDPSREPAWVIGQDLQSARRELHLAEVEFELEFGIAPKQMLEEANARAN